jgi:inorganic triphosphatase YgiF
LVLRVRSAGEHRLQTIKTVKKGARGAFARDEWEEEIESDAPNLRLAKGTALEPLATKKLRRKLKPISETVVERTIFPIYAGGADLQVAVDYGLIKADGRHEPISEIEIELKDGNPAGIAHVADRLAGSAPSPIWRNPSRNAAMRSVPTKQRSLFVPARSTSIPRYRRRRHSRSPHCPS